MAWYQIHYAHDECGTAWYVKWSCACNDRCPVCDKEIEPDDFIDLSTVMEFDGEAGEWVVLQSPPEAEHEPNYREARFKKRNQALGFVHRQTREAAVTSASTR